MHLIYIKRPAIWAVENVQSFIIDSYIARMQYQFFLHVKNDIYLYYLLTYKHSINIQIELLAPLV